MLSYVFRCRLITNDAEQIVPNTEPLPPNTSFAILSYAQVDRYTLVSWRVGGEENYATGETLYLDQTPIAHGAGQLPLWTPPETNAQSFIPTAAEASIFSRIDPALGAFGVPAVVAAELRNPTNQRPA